MHTHTQPLSQDRCDHIRCIFITTQILRERVHLYLYADVEIQSPCWIRRGFLEECCHSLCSAPGADGTVNHEQNTKSFYFFVFSTSENCKITHTLQMYTELICVQNLSVQICVIYEYMSSTVCTLLGKLRPSVAHMNCGVMVGVVFFLGNVSLRWEPPSLSDLFLSSSKRKC